MCILGMLLFSPMYGCTHNPGKQATMGGNIQLWCLVDQNYRETPDRVYAHWTSIPSILCQGSYNWDEVQRSQMVSQIADSTPCGTTQVKTVLVRPLAVSATQSSATKTR